MFTDLIGIFVFCLIVVDVIRPGSFRNGVTKLRLQAANAAAICVKVIGESDYDVFNKRELESEFKKSEAGIKVQTIIERFREGIVDFVEECTSTEYTRVVNKIGDCTEGCTDGDICAICVDFKQELETTFGCQVPNADVPELWKNPWKLCKLLLPPELRDKEYTNNLHCIGLLELIINCNAICDRFSSSIKEHVQQILDIIGDLNCDESVIHELVTCTVAILTDIPGSEQAIDDIKRIQTVSSIEQVESRRVIRFAVCKIADLQYSRDIMQITIDELKGTIIRQQQVIDKIQGDTRKQLETIGVLQGENGVKQAKIDKYQNESRRKQIIIKDLYNNISTKQNTIDALQGEERVMQATIDKYMNENRLQQIIINDLHDNNRTQQDTIDMLRDQTVANLNTIHDMQCQHRHSETTIHKLQCGNRTKESTIDILQQHTKSRQDSIQELRYENRRKKKR